MFPYPHLWSETVYLKVSNTTTTVYSRGSIKWSAIKRLPTIQRQDTNILAEELSLSHSVKGSECINNFGEYSI